MKEKPMGLKEEEKGKQSYNYLKDSYSKKTWKKGDILLSKYEIEDTFDGTFWQAYSARDRSADTRYVLKTFPGIFDWGDEAYKRFTIEGNQWIELEKHRNILPAHYVIPIDGLPCLFLDYVEGTDLTHWIGTRNLDVVQSLDFAIQFCEGMDYAYRKNGIVHGDIKPGNIFVTTDKVVKITDFGLIRVFDSLEVPDKLKQEKDLASYAYRLTRTGYGLGVPLYMSYEREGNKAILNGKTDIFSFAFVLMEMLASKDISFSDAWKDHLYKFWDSLRKSKTEVPALPFDASVPEELRAIITRCLRRNPDERYQNFGDLRDDLLKIYGEIAGKAFDLRDKAEVLTDNDWSAKGRAFYMKGEHNEAIRCYNKALEINPQNEIVWSRKGHVLSKLQRSNEAIKCFSKALQINPEDKTVWSNLGHALSDLRRYSEAVECYTKALSIDPEDVGILNEKGKAFASLGCHKDALTCYSAALVINARYTDALKNKSLSLLSLGLNKDALCCLNEALKQDPQDAELWSLLGKTLHALSRHDDALECYDKALSINKDLSETWCNKGKTLSILGRHNEAISCFNNSLVLQPRNESAWNLKGASLSVLGRKTDAVDCFTMAVEINSRSVEAWVNRGMALGSMGKGSEAADCFSKALNINPVSLEARNGMNLYSPVY
jgi:tetratricopeptide (TPR) repeat protein